MEPFDPRLRTLALQLGILFNADGYPLLLPVRPDRSGHDVGVMADACRIENSLGFEDIDETRQILTEVAESIDEWSHILGKNDRRVRILWAMHAVANAIVNGSRAPTEEELGLTDKE